MIVTAGENVVDLIARDGDYAPRAGGSPFNVAIALGRLGIPSGYATPLSADFFGDFMHCRLRESGARYLPARRSPHPSSLAFVRLAAGGMPSYSFYRRRTADTAFIAADLPRLPMAAACLHLSGSSALAAPGVGGILERYAAARPKRALLSLDPNVRPALIASRAGFLRRFVRLAKSAAMIKMSEEDAAYLYPGARAAQAAEWMKKQGVALFMLTRGATGAALFSREADAEIPAVKIKAVDTVGAGDCFQAAVFARLWRKRKMTAAKLAGLSAADLRDIGEYACACAAFNCRREGCDPPRPADLAAGPAAADRR